MKKGQPHQQSEAIPESAQDQDYHGLAREQQELGKPKNLDYR